MRSDTSVDDKILGIVERLGQAHRSFLQDLATRYGLTPLQVQVISALGEGPPPMPYVGDIARELGITQPSASDAVAALEAKGYVSRVVDTQDRRRVALGLTEAGEELDRRLVRDRSILRSALAAIPEEHHEPLLEAMQRLLTTMSNAGVVSQARNCYTCRHFDVEPAGYRCNAYQETLLAAELRVNCADHGART
ncbi:MAG: MarR family winged helix-turn-helix transcriptional regulator [Ilumatobacteraceae bacterium]